MSRFVFLLVAFAVLFACFADAEIRARRGYGYGGGGWGGGYGGGYGGGMQGGYGGGYPGGGMNPGMMNGGAPWGVQSSNNFAKSSSVSASNTFSQMSMG
ncbi:hypothetical protein L596_000594 [Steinernema carpocapsae]|uniref:Uncharacterized protein n=1 Tax=Steinernema carpocapsae TaxID=34508 RepID=A0A4V6I756_STECR|nr:hypothetical protein L596_000594 [Steinernema carpocapsae]